MTGLFIKILHWATTLLDLLYMTLRVTEGLLA